MEEQDVGVGVAGAGADDAPAADATAHPPAAEAAPRYAGSLGRLLIRGGLLGILGGTLALLIRGSDAAFGAVVGCVAAAVYSWGYLRSHVSKAGRARIFDPALARQSTFRIVLLALAGVAMLAVGREPFKAYLAAFAVSFIVLVALEAPAVFRDLRANGLMG